MTIADWIVFFVVMAETAYLCVRLYQARKRVEELWTMNRRLVDELEEQRRSIYFGPDGYNSLNRMPTSKDGILERYEAFTKGKLVLEPMRPSDEPIEALPSRTPNTPRNPSASR